MSYLFNALRARYGRRYLKYRAERVYDALSQPQRRILHATKKMTYDMILHIAFIISFDATWPAEIGLFRLTSI